MIKKRRYGLFFLFGAVLYAQSEIHLPVSFHAQFKQTITNDKKKVITYQGELDFSTPDHFKWRYTSPTKKEVCTDGERLQVVDHDLEQVSVYAIDKGLDLPAILKSAKMHQKSVYVAAYKGTNYTIQVSAQQELSRIAYKDNLDNTVLIVFSQVRYKNKKIEETRMQCGYPEFYDQVGN